MKNGVYLYFGDVMTDGGTLLTNGSFADLKELGITPTEGTRLTFYDIDADDLGRPTYLCADGVLHLDDESKTWRAFVDQNTFRSVLRSDADL
jgi:hypothetical protein